MRVNSFPHINFNSIIAKDHEVENYKIDNLNRPQFKDLYLNNRFKVLEKIGEKTYSVLFKVLDVLNNKYYVIKVVPKENFHDIIEFKFENEKNRQKKIYDYFYNLEGNFTCKEFDLEEIKKNGLKIDCFIETALHLYVHNHPNIITINKVFDFENVAVLILLDYFEQGDLFKNIIENNIFKLKQIDEENQFIMKNVILQIIDAIEYCDKKNIYHCDLKPENILVRYNKSYKKKKKKNLKINSIIDYDEIHVVIIDFGLSFNSKFMDSRNCRGSSYYMAPERLINYQDDFVLKSLIFKNDSLLLDTLNLSFLKLKMLPTLPADVWSIGILIINITCSMNPWGLANLCEINFDQFNEKDIFSFYMLYDQNLLSKILPISYDLNKLLNKIFKLNPFERISLFDLKKYIITCNFF